MQRTSEQYNASMRQLIRNHSTVVIAIGEVNADVQLQAKGRSGYSGYSMYFCRQFYLTNSIIFKNGADQMYSILEEDFTPADGSMMFPPREGQTELYRDTGYISNNLLVDDDYGIQAQFALTDGTEEIEVPFTVTVEFYEYAPKFVRLSVWNGAYAVHYEINNNTDMIVSHTFATLPNNTDIYILNITCKPDTDNYRRLRIRRIQFGTGVLLVSDILEEVDTEYHCSRINEDLPTADCTVKLVNYDSRYDADNPDNPLKILDEEKQTLDIHFGYDVENDGNYEWVHGGKFTVDNWSSSEHKAQITGKDILQNDEEKYIHDNNTMLSDGTHSTCAEWVLDICGYGIAQFEKKIPILFDADLWRMYITIPVPSLSRKECLQLIANYACKTMYIDRDGTIIISSHSDSTQVMDKLYTITVTGAETLPYELSDDIDDDYRYVYGRVTDLTTGFKYNVPVEIVNDEWHFFPDDWGISTNVTFEVYGENVLDESPIEIQKDDIIEDIQINKEELVKEVIVPYYKEIYQPIDDTPIGTNLFDLDNVEQGSITSSGVPIDSTTRLRSADYVVLEAGTYILSAPGFQVSMLVYSMTESYISGESYSNWYNSPKVLELTAKRKVKFVFRKSNDSELEPTDLVDVMLEFGDTVSTFEFYKSSRQIWEDENVYGDSTGHYDLYVDLGDMYTNVKVVVDGRECVEQLYADIVSLTIDVPYDGNPHTVAIDADCQTTYTSQNVVYPVNATGKSLEWKNPLVATEARAEAIAQFVGDYVDSNIFYDYDYRGNPEYDVNDTIRQENDFTPDMQTIITDHKIGFNGGLSGQITSRRRTDNE